MAPISRPGIRDVSEGVGEIYDRYVNITTLKLRPCPTSRVAMSSLPAKAAERLATRLTRKERPLDEAGLADLNLHLTAG
jgi:hypothetical protein